MLFVPNESSCLEEFLPRSRGCSYQIESPLVEASEFNCRAPIHRGESRGSRLIMSTLQARHMENAPRLIADLCFEDDLFASGCKTGKVKLSYDA